MGDIRIHPKYRDDGGAEKRQAVAMEPFSELTAAILDPNVSRMGLQGALGRVMGPMKQLLSDGRESELQELIDATCRAIFERAQLLDMAVPNISALRKAVRQTSRARRSGRSGGDDEHKTLSDDAQSATWLGEKAGMLVSFLSGQSQGFRKFSQPRGLFLAISVAYAATERSGKDYVGSEIRSVLTRTASERFLFREKERAIEIVQSFSGRDEISYLRDRLTKAGRRIARSSQALERFSSTARELGEYVNEDVLKAYELQSALRFSPWPVQLLRPVLENVRYSEKSSGLILNTSMVDSSRRNASLPPTFEEVVAANILVARQRITWHYGKQLQSLYSAQSSESEESLFAARDDLLQEVCILGGQMCDLINDVSARDTLAREREVPLRLLLSEGAATGGRLEANAAVGLVRMAKGQLEWF